jgi:hypothetical protein
LLLLLLCLQEILRVLKPGQYFAGYEWCATDLYDPANPNHKSIMAEIELGNGLPDVRCVFCTVVDMWWQHASQSV